jgi:hypothetical protein
MNAAPMGQCIDHTMMILAQWIVLNVIYQWAGFTQHLDLYSRVVAGVKMPEATAEDWAKQNQLRQEWLANNPDADYIGWTSIWRHAVWPAVLIMDLTARARL